MANFMLVRHKVKDFGTWKKGYDDHHAKRDAAGLTEKYLMRKSSDPNEVVILFEAGELSRAREFAESADLKEAMERVGVVDKPDIFYLNN